MNDGPISVYDVLVVAIDQMAGLAWIKLGLQPDLRTGEFTVDLVEAKVAIDCVAMLSEQVKPRLDDADRREMENLLANLRINYVEKSR